MPNVGEIIWGDTTPLGGSGGEPAPAPGPDALPCAERRTRRMLDGLSSVFDRDPSLRVGQAPVFRAVAETLCAWGRELANIKDAARVASAVGEELEGCGANYGVSRPNIGLTDAQYRVLILLCAFTPKGTVDIVRRAVDVLIGLEPTITEPGDYTVRIEIPVGSSLAEGFALGFYPSDDVLAVDTDPAGRGRGYAGEDLLVADSTGQSYAYGAALGEEALSILNKLVMAGVRVEVVTV